MVYNSVGFAKRLNFRPFSLVQAFGSRVQSIGASFFYLSSGRGTFFCFSFLHRKLLLTPTNIAQGPGFWPRPGEAQAQGGKILRAANLLQQNKKINVFSIFHFLQITYSNLFGFPVHNFCSYLIVKYRSSLYCINDAVNVFVFYS